MKRLSRFMLFVSVVFSCGALPLAAEPIPSRAGVCDVEGAAVQRSSCGQPRSAGVACRGPIETATHPLLLSLTFPPNPVPSGVWVDISAQLRAAGERQRATIDWGDGSTTAVIDSSTMVLRSHRYAPGVYSVAVSVTNGERSDCRSSSAEQTSYLVVYDAAAAHVTGNGWLESEAGQCTAAGACTAGNGVAQFGFVFGYQDGTSAPVGHADVRLQDGAFRFKSMTYHRVAISGARAQLRGSGWVNGVAGYDFMLSVDDRQRVDDRGRDRRPDRFGIRIWEKASGRVVYDNQRAIRGGQIAVRKSPGSVDGSGR